MSKVSCFFLGDRPEESRFNPPQMRDSTEYYFRPPGKPYGGLWTSPAARTRRGDWFSWCQANARDRLKADLWKLTAAAPKVYVIKSERSLKEAVERWPRRYDADWNHPEIDFEKVAEEYDAVYLTRSGLFATRFAWPIHLVGWDVATILWLRWVFDSVEQVKRSR